MSYFNDLTLTEAVAEQEQSLATAYTTIRRL